MYTDERGAMKTNLMAAHNEIREAEGGGDTVFFPQSWCYLPFLMQDHQRREMGRVWGWWGGTQAGIVLRVPIVE